MKVNKWSKNLLFNWFTVSLITLISNIAPAQSQITPDETLDEESSSVTPNVEINGTPSTRIDGGATRGTNLFHSFSEFNVGEGQGSYFTNPAGIENILGRVTGGNPSEILGRLGVSGGDANLFLINPNGIIFGENASLDLGGSFMATTANSIGLGESGSFNATQPQTSNLLSVNPSALFFNAVAAQPIVNRSQAASLSGEKNSNGQPVGLEVAEGKSLALVGGDLFLYWGNLTVTKGKIDLVSVAGTGEVSLNQSKDSWLLGYEGVGTAGNIIIRGGVVQDEVLTIFASNFIYTDTNFITNNLTTLPQVFLNTEDLIATSCIARRNQQTGSFFITGKDSLPLKPTLSDDSAYPTSVVRTIPRPKFLDDERSWQKGDPIIEPTGVYRLPNGELVMSRECSQ